MGGKESVHEEGWTKCGRLRQYDRPYSWWHADSTRANRRAMQYALRARVRAPARVSARNRARVRVHELAEPSAFACAST
eukprot:4454661-Pleurochrysis_carterae.AAC.1